MLLALRNQRKQPHRDDKALAAWNGLAIHGLATAAESLGDAALLDDAVDAARFVLDVLRGPTGMCRSWRGGVRGGPAFLEDYGACILGLSALARALTVLSPKKPSLAGELHSAAIALAGEASKLFRNPDGTWFDTAPGQSDSFVRTRSLHDGAVPCGSSMLLLGFLERARSGNADAMVHAESLLRSMAGAIDDMPLGLAWGTRAVLQLASNPAFASSPVRALVTGSGTSTSEASQAFSPVEVFSSVDRVALASDTPGVLRLALRIAPGYHVLAADPWVDDPKSAMRGLIPLRVHVRGGTGIEAYADYPAGEPYTAAAAVLGTPRVYSGEVDFEVALEQTGEINGRPLLAVTFQACSDRECLAPRTVELDIAIDQASTP